MALPMPPSTQANLALPLYTNFDTALCIWDLPLSPYVRDPLRAWEIVPLPPLRPFAAVPRAVGLRSPHVLLLDPTNVNVHPKLFFAGFFFSVPHL